MRSRRKTTLSVGIVMIVICGALFAYLFAHDFDSRVDLGNGYALFRAEEGPVIDRSLLPEAENERLTEKWKEDTDKGPWYEIEDKGAPRVGPSIDGYYVHPGLITGCVSAPAGKPYKKDPRSEKLMKQGYFVIDTNTNTITRGLSKPEWRLQLRKYGLKHEPKLLTPTN